MCDLCVSGVTEILQLTDSAGSLPDLLQRTRSKSVTGALRGEDKCGISSSSSNKRPDRGRRCSFRQMGKSRIDAVLAERGIFPSRSAAAGAVRAGEVRIGRDGPVALRPSQLVEPDANLVVAEGRRFVSRGGTKLENALDALGIEVSGRDCLDVGASTGGFSDCLLQRGAARVAAVDVAYGQLDVRLRQDPRVHVIERLNARELAPVDLPFAPSLATVDVSFISLTKVLPAVARCLEPGGEVLAMVKPQFELGRERVGKGVVRDPAGRRPRPRPSDPRLRLLRPARPQGEPRDLRLVRRRRSRG